MASDGFTLTQFSADHSVDSAPGISSYIHALEAFDSIEQLQELKALEHQHMSFSPGQNLLDVGCGFGLETLEYARVEKGKVTGIDASADFIAEAQRRATVAGLKAEFAVADATAIPWADSSFDCVRAERVLIYLENPAAAVQEMKRVLRPAGRLALIEPDFSTTTINLSNRSLVRRTLAHEIDTAVVQSWLPGPLLRIISAVGFQGINIASRVLIFPQPLCSQYFSGVGERAAKVDVISESEREEWTVGIQQLAKRNELFGSVGYFLFTATIPSA